MASSNKKALLQIKVWSCAAKVLPLTFLAFLFLSYVIGDQTYYGEFLVYGGTTFFGIAVVWWWWAMDKIRQFVQTLDNTAEKLLNIADEVKSVKDDIKNDLDNR